LRMIDANAVIGLREKKREEIGFTISIRLLRWRFSKFRRDVRERKRIVY
jgi:hypothetical protein